MDPSAPPLSASRDDPPPQDAAGESIRRSAGLAFVAQLVGAVFTAALTLFLARKLGASGYGVLSLALGIAGLVLLPSDFGVSGSVARFAAEHRGDGGRVALVVADGLRLKLIVSAVITALLCALAQPIASLYGIPALTWPIRGMAIALFGQSIMMMSAAFVALARVRFQVWTAVAESSVEVTASVALVLAGAGVTGAAFGRAIGFVAGAAMTLFLLVRLLGTRILPRGLRFGADTRRIASYAGYLLVIDGAYTLFNQIDILIIGAYLSAQAVGIFSAPLRLIAFLAYPGTAIAAGVSPRLARNRRQEPNVDAFVTSIRVLLILQGAIAAFVLAWAPLLVEVGLGSGYEQSVGVLRGLTPMAFLLGFGVLVSLSANYLGEARRRVPIAISTVILNLAIDLVLVPRIGVSGAVIGTDVAYGLYAPAHLVLCQRVLGLDLRPILLTLLRTLLAGAAMTAVLLAFSGPIAEAWKIPLGSLAGMATFAAALWLTREVRGSELAELLGAMRLRRG